MSDQNKPAGSEWDDRAKADVLEIIDDIRRETARRCAEIADNHPPFLNDGIDGRLIAAAIRREFGLDSAGSENNTDGESMGRTN